MSQKQVPLVLITGFLGSGKTTFLKKIVEAYAPRLTLGLIQNEFAPASVDAVEIQSTGSGFSVLEINNGSVFCLCQLDSFIDSASAFLDKYKPDMLLLEASGLSDPVGIAEILQGGDLSKRCFLHKTVCIVDAENFLRTIRVSRPLKHQVMIADHILVNKTDRAGETALKEIRSAISKLNPHARMDRVIHCDIPAEQVVGPDEALPAAYSILEDNSMPKPSRRPEVGVGVLKSSRKITKKNLEKLLAEYLPLTYRMKGFVTLADGSQVSVQTSFDMVSVKEINGYLGPTELIAIGEDFNFRIFAKRYRELAKGYGA